METLKVARCPQCRCSSLILTEVHEEVGETDAGEHVINDGVIYPAGPFWFNVGDPVRVLLDCTGCGHSWRTRRVVGPSAEDPT